MANQYDVLGLMSGTSLDGLDIAHCRFAYNEKWTWEIIACETFAYDSAWQEKLSKAHLFSAAQLCELDAELAELHSRCVLEFLREHEAKIDFISSHGHTVLHSPKNHYTCQISNGGIIAAKTGIPVVSDFRTQDVALGGQGAPLVPCVEYELFDGFDGFLNLGGIANISSRSDAKITAYDICTCNMLLNACASLKGEALDFRGHGASQGAVIPDLLDLLNSHSYYKQREPGSIGKEFFEHHVWPLTAPWRTDANHLLRTTTEHIAQTISNHLPDKGRILVSGGGAFNDFLIQRLRSLTHSEIHIAGSTISAFKEALVFAFLGVLRWKNEINCLSEATGACRNHCAGAVYVI